MKKLNKSQLATQTSLGATLTEQAQAVSSLSEQLNTAITEYNETLGEAREWRDEIVAAMEEYEGNRSDKWREGDAGANYANWMSEFRDLDLDDLEEVEELDPSHADELGNLHADPDENT